MTEEMEHPEDSQQLDRLKPGAEVRIETSLTIDGDWRSDPLKLMAGLREGSRSLDRWQRKAVKAARKQGRTWAEIGAACGISRQAAWERFSSD